VGRVDALRWRRCRNDPDRDVINKYAAGKGYIAVGGRRRLAVGMGRRIVVLMLNMIRRAGYSRYGIIRIVRTVAEGYIETQGRILVGNRSQSRNDQ
jgi:hypothetical protein